MPDKSTEAGEALAQILSYLTLNNPLWTDKDGHQKFLTEQAGMKKVQMGGYAYADCLNLWSGWKTKFTAEVNDATITGAVCEPLIGRPQVKILTRTPKPEDSY